MAYHPKMSKPEREARVLERMARNTVASRQSGGEWTEALNAYRAWLAARDSTEKS